MEIARKPLAVLSAASVVAWVVSIVTSKHHHAITFWLVVAEGLLALTFCAAWLDARGVARRLRTPDPLGGWVQGRIDAATLIKRHRQARGDQWFIAETARWEVENVTHLDKALAPDLVDKYRRSTPGLAPPFGAPEAEAHFERQITWLRQTLRDLQPRRFGRTFLRRWERS